MGGDGYFASEEPNIADQAVNAVVLAGAPADEEMSQALGIKWRAEALVGGKRMLDRVITSLKQCDRIGRVIAVSPVDCEADLLTAPEESFVGNVMAGVRAASDDGADGQQVLLVSSDIPLASSGAFADVVDAALACDADFAYPVIRKEDCVSAYPDFSRTYQRIKEGTFTGGNAMLVRCGFLMEIEGRIQELYLARKKPLKLAGKIGYGILLRAIVAQKLYPAAIDITTLEAAAGRLLGGKLRGFVCRWPEIGEDLDRLEDIRRADAILDAAASIQASGW